MAAAADADPGALYEWGGYGLAAVARLRGRLAADGGDGALLAQIDQLQAAHRRGELQEALAARGWGRAAVHGPAVLGAAAMVRELHRRHPRWRLECAARVRCALVAVEIVAAAPGVEHCLVRIDGGHGRIHCFAGGGAGELRYLGRMVPRGGADDARGWDAMLDAIEGGDWGALAPAVRDLRAGESYLYLREGDDWTP